MAEILDGGLVSGPSPDILEKPIAIKPVPVLELTDQAGTRVVLKGRVALHPELDPANTNAGLMVQKYDSAEHAAGGKPFEVSIDNEE